MSVQKAPVHASRFVPKLTLGKQTSTAILHTRAATTGGPENNANNHPIIAPGLPTGKRVIGTHNGWVNNLGSLIRRHNLPRHAEVDSEVIFSMLARYGSEEYGEDYETIGAEVYGTYACAWIRENEPGRLYLMRGNSSPLVLLETEYGIFYASTEWALGGLDNLIGSPKLGYLEVIEGRALVIEDGKVQDVQKFRFNYNYYQGGHYTYLPNGTWEKQTGTTTYPRGAAYEPQKAYTNKQENRRTWLNTAATDLADYLDLKKKGDYFTSEHGQYVKAGIMAVDFTPFEKTRDVEEAAVEDLLFLSAANKLPESIEEDMMDLMDKVYGTDWRGDDKDTSTGKQLALVRAEDAEDVERSGFASNGQRYIVLGGQVLLKNDQGEFEDTGLSYEDFVETGNPDVIDDSIADAIISKTLAERL